MKLSKPLGESLASVDSFVRAGSLLALLLGGAPAAHAGDLVSIPIRWCALENTPTVNDPSAAPVASEESVDDALWRRHERASDNVWIPQAGITFRSAFTGELAETANFPVIPDPCPPRGTLVCRAGERAGFTCASDDDCGGESCAATGCAAACPAAACNGGQVGDIHSGTTESDGTLEALERDLAVSACNMAWQALNDAGDTNTPGIAVINVNRVLSRFGGGASEIAGFAEEVPLGAGDDVCPAGSPTLVSDYNGGSVVIIDNQNFADLLSDGDRLAKQERQERTLAHELGHVFQIWHGNGLDDDGDSGFDQRCDPADGGGVQLEEGADLRWCAEPGSIMSQDRCPDSVANLNMSGNQTQVVQGVANNYLNMVEDPPGVLVPGASAGDHRFDPIGDGSSRAMDLLRLDYQMNAAREELTLRLALAGILQLGPSREYWLLFDLDDDRETGGDTQELETGTVLPGTDLAARLLVLSPPNANLPVVVSTVWTHDGSVFALCDPNFFPECFDIEAAIEPVFTVSDGLDGSFERRLSSTNLRLTLPSALVPARSPSPRVFAKSRLQPAAGADTDDDDCLPGCGVSAGVRLHTGMPNFPVCTTDPLRAVPGQTVRVIVRNFPPESGRAKAFVGDQKVLLGDPVTGGQVDDVAVDGAGEATFDITIPADATTGTRLLTVGLVGKALTADCPLELEQDVQITGTPVGGGTVRIGLDGQVITVPTTAGQTNEDLVRSLRATFDSNDVLRLRGTTVAELAPGVLSINARVSELASTDPGVQIVEKARDLEPPVAPTGLGIVVICLLALAAVLLIVLAIRKARAGS